MQVQKKWMVYGMEELVYVDRKNTNCNKWDGQTGMFGEEGLHAMWVADMDFRVPQGVVDALKEYVEQGVFGYYKIPESYYEAFIKWEKEQHGFTVEKKWMRFSPGVVAAFHWFVQILSEPGDAVIVNTPVYYPFLHAVKNNNRKLICSDLINEDGKYHIDYEDFEKKIVENQVKIFILCSPHNPAGRVWKKEADMMVAITAPSKTFNLAGGQNSIVIIPDDKLRKKWDTFVDGIRVRSGNPFGYIAAEAAYRTGVSWLESVKAQIRENEAYVRETFEKELPDVVVSPLEGTSLCWIDLGAYVPAEKVKEVVQKRCHLAVDFGDWFGGSRFGTFIRMNLATSPENVKIGVDALVRELKK